MSPFSSKNLSKTARIIQQYHYQHQRLSKIACSQKSCINRRNLSQKLQTKNNSALKCRVSQKSDHFVEIQEMARNNNFDILSFSETWFDPSVFNSGVHLDGYKIFRLDRPRTKAKSKGGGVCACSGISESGVHQLWLLAQHRKLKSLLVCITYRPPDTPISFLNDDLMPAYTQALLLNKDIYLTGDLNCDVLPENYNSEGWALLSFYTDVNATQLIDKPTRVTATSRTLIDIITVSNPGLVRTSDVQELTISDHYLVYASLDLKFKVPKQSKISITIRTFKNYVAKELAEYISRIPWDSLELLNSIDEKVEAFNDLFMACLDKHAPLKSLRTNPSRS